MILSTVASLPLHTKIKKKFFFKIKTFFGGTEHQTQTLHVKMFSHCAISHAYQYCKIILASIFPFISASRTFLGVMSYTKMRRENRPKHTLL